MIRIVTIKGKHSWFVSTILNEGAYLPYSIFHKGPQRW